MMEILLLIIPTIIWVTFSKYKWPHEVTWYEAVGQVVIVALVIYGCSEMGRYNEAKDVEILNGQVTGKERENDDYVRSYDCNCRTVKTGKNSSGTVCDTCYEDRYTVTWDVYTTLGSYRIKSLDSTSRRVWDTPDPTRYTIVKYGDPASKHHSYLNYLKAVPQSLTNFHLSASAYKIYKEKNMLPNYPKVYDHYNIKRVINYGAFTPKLSHELDKQLSLRLRTLGAKKQVNVIVVLVPHLDQDYRYALERHWKGGKKNDVVLILGSTGDDKIEMAEIITYAGNKGNELFTVTMRDKLLKSDFSNSKQVSEDVAEIIDNLFDRLPASEFEYLKEEIDPPAWLLGVLALITLLLNSAVTFFSLRNNLTSN